MIVTGIAVRQICLPWIAWRWARPASPYHCRRRTLRRHTERHGRWCGACDERSAAPVCRVRFLDGDNQFFLYRKTTGIKSPGTGILDCNFSMRPIVCIVVTVVARLALPRTTIEIGVRFIEDDLKCDPGQPVILIWTRKAGVRDFDLTESTTVKHSLYYVRSLLPGKTKSQRVRRMLAWNILEE